jgi:hypothetical protein
VCIWVRIQASRLPESDTPFEDYRSNPPQIFTLGKRGAKPLYSGTPERKHGLNSVVFRLQIFRVFFKYLFNFILSVNFSIHL